MLKYIFFCILIFSTTNSVYTIDLGRIHVSELFYTKLEPSMFNWTLGLPQHFQYRPSLKNYPDLPSWMRYIYSNEYNAGYLYGTPPLNIAGQTILLDIVGLNKLTYETKTIALSFQVANKNVSAVNSVQMKIDNLNWVHLMDPGRVENLKNIFRNDLWHECKSDIHIMFMESAIRMGGRNPLRPQQKEGVIVHLGSTAPFSTRLTDLQEEVKPLYKIASCTYKRTSVQTIFENAGFKMDWCAFRIMSNEASANKPHGSEKSVSLKQGKWEPIARTDVPQRNYIDEFAFAIAIPVMILSILVAILSAVLCLYQDNMDEDFKPLPNHTVEYSTSSMTTHNQPPAKPLKSLKDPNEHLMDDEQSLGSQSPCNSTFRVDGSPMGNSTLRPRPPPYKRSTTIYKNGVQI